MNHNRLIFYTSPPALSELSCINFAINLWRYEIITRWSTGRISQICELFASFRQEHMLPLPTRIHAMLFNHVELVKREIEGWIKYQCNRIFDKRSIYAIEFLTDFFDRIVWLPIGIIDYEATAQNMLESDRLTELEKYAVACTYCLEEDIVRLKHMREKTSRCEDIVFIQHSLIYYWQYRLADKIPVKPNNIADFNEIDIMDWPAVDNWPAIRFFWKYLDENEQANQAVRIIARYNDAKFTPNILAKLTEQQFNHVVERTASFMMLRMINNPKLAEYTFQTWLHVRHIISKEQFFEMIRGIMNTKIRYSGTLSDDEVYLRVRIWSSADDHLKQTALMSLMDENTPFEYRGSLKKLPREMVFLMNILADASSEQRNFIWRQNWSSLIYGANPCIVEDLMCLCLKTPNDVIQFKQQTMSKFVNIQKYCLELAEERLFAELNDFLTFCCSSDREKILNIKQQILQSCFSGENLIFNYHILRDLDKLDEFIDDVFQDEYLAKNYKKQMVLLPANVEFVQYVIENGDLRLVKNLFSSFLPFEPDLKWIKSHFLDLCRSSLSSANFWKFEVLEWQEFIEWCAGSERRMREFKKSIRLDHVFKTVLTRCFEFQNHTHCCSIYTKCDNDMKLFTLLNNFLLWYFGSPESIERFKLNQIRRYDEIEILKMIFTEGGECIVRDTLAWFFNGDGEEIEKFKMIIGY